jgi:hypothetical protein
MEGSEAFNFETKMTLALGVYIEDSELPLEFSEK